MLYAMSPTKSLAKQFAKACAEPAALAAHDDSLVVGGGVQIRGALGSAKGVANGGANGLANGFANIVVYIYIHIHMYTYIHTYT